MEQDKEDAEKGFSWTIRPFLWFIINGIAIRIVLGLVAGTAFAAGTAPASGSVFRADDWTGKRRKTQEQWINTTDVKGPFTDNAEANNYELMNEVDRSYLVPFSDGSMMMVQAEKHLQVRYLDKGYRQTGERNIKLELPLFGGFLASSDGNYYVIVGQKNPGDSDKVEVIRVIQYDSKWKRKEAWSLFGGNTSEPFVGGLHCTEDGKHLYIRTGHTMYKGKDGYKHQANMAIDLDKEKMQAVYTMTGVSSIGASQYVSHSFNQLVTTKDDIMVGADHGDAYPRAIVLGKNKRALSESDGGNGEYINTNVCPIPGTAGDNDTGVSLGDIMATDTHILAAYNKVYDEYYKNKSKKTRNIFLATVENKKGAFGKPSVRQITDYAQGMDPARTPHLIQYGKNEYLLLWTRHTTIFYTALDGKGKGDGRIHSFEGNLSDCKPVLCGGFITWYAVKNNKITFYRIDPEHIDWGSSLVRGDVKSSTAAVEDLEPAAPVVTQPEPEKPEPEPQKPVEPAKPPVTEEKQVEPEKPKVEQEKPASQPQPAPQPQPEPPKPVEPPKPKIPRSVDVMQKGKASLLRNYEYTTGDFTTADKCYVWDFSEYISDPGEYTIIFNCQSGVGIVMSEAAVFVDGKYFAPFNDIKRIEKTMDLSAKKGRFTFTLPKKAKKVQLAAFVRTTKKSKFYGTIDVIHDRLLIIPRGRTKLLYEEFSERKDFDNVRFPDTLVEIGPHSLERTPMVKVEVPGTIKKLGDFAFFDMPALQEIVLHEGVEELGEYCINLREYRPVTVDMPDSMSVFARYCVSNNSTWIVNKGSRADEYAKKQRFVTIKYRDAVYATPPEAGQSLPQEAVTPKGTMKNYAYGTGDFTTSEADYVWDFSAYVSQAGQYSILFNRISGASLVISGAVIMADGKQIASIPQTQTADGKKRVTLSFSLPAAAKSVQLKATAKMAKKGSYKGTIDILRGSTLVIPTGRTVIEREEYRKRTDFTSIVFPPSLTEIGNSAFEGCALKAVDIPGNVKKLDRYAFFACKSLTEVKMQEGVKEIGEWAFCGITNRMRIYIPSTITEFSGGVTENMAIWVIYKGSKAEDYAKGMNYKVEYR